VSPDELPPAGQKFYDDFSKEYDQAPDEVDPYAIYGYEAARAIIDCIEESAGSINPDDLTEGRQAVIDCFFAIENRESPLGTYSIDDDGDTTLTTYGGYIAKGGKLVFNKVIEQEGA
jgi:branched-chain amino acid transport system substrate-binding protein